MNKLIFVFFLCVCAVPCLADVDVNLLADAIGRAENSKAYPFGIMVKYKKTTPRQACINTINHKLRDFKKEGSKGDFIEYLQKTYAPIGAKNDPTGLNKNWTRIVKFHYSRLTHSKLSV